MRHWLNWLAGGSLVVALALAIAAPPEATQREFAKMLFIHPNAAWTAYIAFALTLGGSIAYLLRRSRAADRLAASSAELGVFFVGLTIVTGMIWGRPVWNAWWDWQDARMMSTAVLFFLYLGYLALRRSTAQPEDSARRSAVFGIVAFAMVPVVHFSVTWWRTLHQPAGIIRPDPQLDAAFVAPMIAGFIAFTLVFAAFLRERMELAKLEEQLAERRAEAAVAGSAIAAPKIGEVGDV